MNYHEDDYVMGYLLTEARRSGQSRLMVDILSGHAAPHVLMTTPVAASVRAYCDWFPDLVAAHGTDMRFIHAAAMEIVFDLAVHRAVRGTSLVESPFACRVSITDDRGKSWDAEIRDWWYPGATGPAGGTARRRGVIRRLVGLLRGWHGGGPQVRFQAAA
ncbi:MAG: hypothetical protein ABIR59_03705 [Gemmatimonadales bacterium]